LAKKPRQKRPGSLVHRLEAILVRIPITTETLTTALVFTQTIIALAAVVKIPLQVEKVATLETELVPTVTPALIVPTIGIPPIMEPVKEGEK
jgi:hypothetical protein